MLNYKKRSDEKFSVFYVQLNKNNLKQCDDKPANRRRRINRSPIQLHTAHIVAYFSKQNTLFKGYFIILCVAHFGICDTNIATIEYILTDAISIRPECVWRLKAVLCHVHAFLQIEKGPSPIIITQLHIPRDKNRYFLLLNIEERNHISITNKNVKIPTFGSDEHYPDGQLLNWHYYIYSYTSNNIKESFIMFIGVEAIFPPCIPFVFRDLKLLFASEATSCQTTTEWVE